MSLLVNFCCVGWDKQARFRNHLEAGSFFFKQILKRYNRAEINYGESGVTQTPNKPILLTCARWHLNSCPSPPWIRPEECWSNRKDMSIWIWSAVSAAARLQRIIAVCNTINPGNCLQHNVSVKKKHICSVYTYLTTTQCHRFPPLLSAPNGISADMLYAVFDDGFPF